jgi:hypothetical protein
MSLRSADWANIREAVLRRDNYNASSLLNFLRMASSASFSAAAP